jgi:HEAT repeat protein
MVHNGIDPESAIPVLVALLLEKDTGLRLQAAIYLGGHRTDKVLPVLIEGLNIELKAGSGLLSLHGISRMGWGAKACAPVVVKMLEGGNPEQRLHAVNVLANIGGDSTIIVPALERLFRKETPLQMRLDAIRALQGHGATAIPVLLGAYKDPELKSAVLAAIANLTDLEGANFKGMLPLLAPVMRGPDAELKRAVLKAIVPLRKPALPLVVVALKDADATVRQKAAVALSDIGVKEETIPASLLELARSDADLGVRSLAAISLVGLGDEGSRILFADPQAKRSAIGDVLKNTDSSARSHLLATMLKQNYRSAAAVDGLIACLSDRSAPVRSTSAGVLARIGPDARAAIPALRAALNDDDVAVSYTARKALEQIGER